MNVTLKKTLAYMTLPRIIPRIAELGLNFGFMAYLMAIVFRNIRLLPPTHPYLNPDRVGTYGIHHVLAAGAHNLKGGAKNIDQYIVFGSFVLGTALLFLQFALLIAMFSIHTAAAASFFGFFVTANPTNDVAFIMLDKVFQIPDMFGSQYAPTSSADIKPFSAALQALFAFYSMGMMIVGMLIVLYICFVLVAESARTGTPFGNRFASVYAPLRLCLAVLLLLPISYGFNTGQWITLIAAKWGSSFATNAWNMYNNRVGDNPLGLTSAELTAKPKIQKISSIINFFYLVHTCAAAYDIVYDKEIEPYFIVRTSGGSNADTMVGKSFTDAMTFYDKGDIVVTFGEEDSKYTDQFGHVKPYCGQVSIPIDSKDIAGIQDIYDVYYGFINDLWYNSDLKAYGYKMALALKFRDKGDPASYSTSFNWDAETDAPAGANFYADFRVDRQAYYDALMNAAITNIRSTTNGELQMTQDILDLGWGGAGVWFNRIPAFNGAMSTAMFMVPAPTLYPAVMEHIFRKKQGMESGKDVLKRYSPSTVSGWNSNSLQSYWSGSGLDSAANDTEIATLLDEVYQRVNGDSATIEPQKKLTNNPLMDAFSFIFDSYGLFDIRDNNDVYPLARLASFGKSLIDKTVSFVGGGLILSGLGGAAGAFDKSLGSAFDNAASGMSQFAMIGLGLGIVLYYVIPMLPFLYFFFAVGRWVKSIFEAMVGVPLWALAHLRIDGNGIDGNAATNGYALILEIFLRPIFSIFGLLAGVAIFGAMVQVLDSVFDLVVYNAGGYNPYDSSGTIDPNYVDVARGAIDQFFYTIVYVMVLYSMAISSFKLIDAIPNNLIGRFLGMNVSSFRDGNPDIHQELNRMINSGTQVDGTPSAVEKIQKTVGEMTRVVHTAGSLAGQAAKEAMEKANPPKK